MRETAHVNQLGTRAGTGIDLVPIALQITAAALDQGIGDFAAATGVVVKENNPLVLRARYPHPHPVQRARCLVALEYLNPGLIDTHIPGAAHPLVHQVQQRLQGQVQRDHPQRLGRTRQADLLTLQDLLQPVQRQRIDIFAGHQIRE
jgi:hypothetical protein